MKKTLGILALVCAAGSAFADTVFLNDNFDTYNAGELVGQGGWAQTGTATVANHIQVASGVVTLGTSGQDVYKAFSAPISLTEFNSITVTAAVTITSAQAGGDYFLHLSDPAGTASNFYARLYAKSTTGGFLLGVTPSSGTAVAGNYGSTALTLNTAYSISVTWSHIAGADSFSIFVDGNSYLSGVTTPTFTEPATVAAVNFRQGSAGSAAGVKIDSLTVTAVPEPHEYGIAIAGVLATLIVIRRRNARLAS